MHRVLVIDDEVDVRDGIKRVLDRAGFSVRVIDNASEAIAELQRLPADIVITDIIMPKLNGVDAIELIVREFPAVRIVAISGGGNFDVTGQQPAGITTMTYLTAAKNAGAHLLLTKPFGAQELILAMEQLMSAARG